MAELLANQLEFSQSLWHCQRMKSLSMRMRVIAAQAFGFAAIALSFAASSIGHTTGLILWIAAVLALVVPAAVLISDTAEKRRGRRAAHGSGPAESSGWGRLG
jgi:hypothetical protein